MKPSSVSTLRIVSGPTEFVLRRHRSSAAAFCKNSRYPRGIGSVRAEDQTHELAQPQRGVREIVLPLPMLRSLLLAG